MLCLIIYNPGSPVLLAERFTRPQRDVAGARWADSGKALCKVVFPVLFHSVPLHNPWGVWAFTVLISEMGNGAPQR